MAEAALYSRRAVLRRASGFVLATAGGLALPGRVAAATCWCGHTYGPLHTRIFAQGVDPEYQHMVVLRESNFSPSATNPTSGAAGLCQYLPWIWDWLTDIGVAAGSPYDPYAALDAMDECLRRGWYWMWACTDAC